MANSKPWEWAEHYLPSDYVLDLNGVRAHAEAVMRNPFHLHFTDHSVSHSDRIVEMLPHILWSNLQSPHKLNDFELAILCFSAYLHDIGMQWTYNMGKRKFVEIAHSPYDSYEEVRKTHGARSAAIIKASLGKEGYPAPDLGISASRTFCDLGKYIIDCVSHHHGEYKVEPIKDDFSGKVIRIGLIRGLLRIADTLDMDHRRVDMSKLKLFDIPLDSKVHWWMHYYIKSVRVEGGKIRISFDFPTSVSPPIANFFAGRARKSVTNELELHHDIFWGEMVFLDMDRDDSIVTSFEPGMNKLPLPEELETYISSILRKMEQGGENLLDQRIAPTMNPEARDWISYWGFTGNPWVDLPTSLKKNDFVMTRSVEKLFGLVKSIRGGKKGQIQLLLGDRGMGKTSFFESLVEFFPFEEYDIGIVSLGDNISVIRSSRELSAFVFTRLYRHMKGKVPEKLEVRDLKDALDEYQHKQLVICYDNLDRFTSKEDIDTICHFFAESQAALQAVGKKAIVIIASSPDWESVLKSDQYGYLNYETAWKLEAFNLNETKDLISKRLLIAGKSFDSVFAEDSLPIIRTISRGNPRHVLRRCAMLTESAAMKKANKIDKAFIVKHHPHEVDDNLARAMWDLSSRSKRHKDALVELYYFHDTLERKSLDADKGWDVFLRLTEGQVNASEIDSDYMDPLTFVSDRVPVSDKEVYRRLKQDISEYFRDWCAGGFTVRDFVSLFREKPVHPKDFDVEVLQHVRGMSLPEDAKWYVENGRLIFNKATEENMAPTLVVYLSWKTVDHLLKAYLVKVGAADFGTFADDKVGDDRFIDDTGQIRRKSPKRLLDEARQLLSFFDEEKKKRGLYLKTYDQVRLLLRKREQLMKASPEFLAESVELARENVKICRVALRQVYNEMMSLLL